MMNVAGIPGIAANLLLIFVTIQNNKLRGSANYLLALTAFFEILHQSAHFLFLFITVSGVNFINYSTALKFQLHSIFGLTAAQTSMASIAADRLLSVLFPLKYYKLNIRLYFTIHIILAFISGIWMSINAINFSNKYPTLPVTGYISDLLVLDMEIILQFIMLLCGINVLLYFFVWIVVRWFHSGRRKEYSPFS
uniref:G-protein coupled receptors family 1 profile domain-containing protein n=1 Tax=Meloidogyne incognita TaxID=6306 RepID=A0A914LJP2_MELIC